MDKDRFPTLSEPEDDDSLDSILKRSNPKPFNFRSLVPEKVLFNNESEEDDDDEEEDSKDSKKQKKFTQLLKTVFPKTIEEAPKTTESEVVEKIHDHDEIFSDINTPEAYSTAAGINTLADIPEVQPEPIVELEPVMQEVERLPEESTTPETPNLETAKTSAVSQEDRPNKSIQVQNELKRGVVDTTPPSYAPPMFNETYTTPQIVKQETVVEKHKPVGAIMAFLGAEFLSRRRDKKIERSIKKQSKELTAKIEQVKPKAQVSEPESLASILDRTNYSAHDQVQEVEATPVLSQKAETYSNQNTEQEVRPLFSTDKFELPAKPKVETADRYMHETVQEKIDQTTEVTISSPEVNAENNFESKKDQLRNRRLADQPSLNTVAFGNNSQDFWNQAESKSSSSQQMQVQNSTTTDYRQSMQTGAGIALIILAVFIAVFTLL